MKAPDTTTLPVIYGNETPEGVRWGILFQRGPIESRDTGAIYLTYDAAKRASEPGINLALSPVEIEQNFTAGQKVYLEQMIAAQVDVAFKRGWAAGAKAFAQAAGIEVLPVEHVRG